MTKDYQDFDLEDRLIDFAVRIIALIKPKSKLKLIIEENDQLISIFVASIKTAKENKMKTS
jgi:hypothetical protein